MVRKLRILCDYFFHYFKMHSKIKASSLLMIVWLLVKCNSLPNNITIIKKENPVTNIPVFEDHIIINEFSEGRKMFYQYPPDSAFNHKNKKNIPFHIQPWEIINNEKFFFGVENQSSIEKLENLLTQLQYKPVVVLVDDTLAAFKNAEEYINMFLNKTQIQSEFWLMKYNSSGVTTVTAQSKTNLETFKKQLKQENKNVNNLEIIKGSAVFFAILKATQILPQNAAVLIFSERYPIDENLSQLATTNLRQKHIKLHVVWIGDVSNRGEGKLLEEAAKYTDGLFILGNQYKIKSIYQNLSNTLMNTKKEIIIKKNVQDDRTVDVPIDRTVTDLEIIIEGKFTSACLTSPVGFSVDLLNSDSIKQLTPEASNAHDQGRWAHIRFNIRKVTQTPVVGTWKLRVGGTALGYNLTIYAETDLFFDTHILLSAQEPYRAKHFKEKQIEFYVHGDVSIIDDVSIVNISGNQILEVPYSLLKDKNFTLNENTTYNKHQLTLPQNTSIPVNSFYIKVNGKNKNGETFSRLSYVDQNVKQQRRRSMISIETGIHSELIASPGSNPKIIFEVTNNNDYSVAVQFNVQDEKSMLRGLFPTRIIIGPKQTAEVTVTLMIPPSTTLDFTNIITLTSYSQERTQKSAMLYVTNNRFVDNVKPYLNYKFTSNCLEISYSSCQAAFWTIEVTAQDYESGLLLVASRPSGLYSLNDFISGTKELVKLYYSSNCCQPKIEITAVDLNNNKRFYTADANYALLNTGSIIAVVLGVVILAVIIIVIIVLISRRCKQRNSVDLPRYRGQIGISRF